MRHAVVVIDKIWNCCMCCTYVCTFVYLQTARSSPLRPIGDVTEAETQSRRCWNYGDASVRMRTQRGAEGMLVVSAQLTCLTR